MKKKKGRALDWFRIATELKAISQAGKHFAKDHYEMQRHLRLEEIAADILAAGADLPAGEILGALRMDMGYPTPKVDCRGVVFRDEKILLVREIADGLWTLPGGWCDVGMTPAENVVREVFEESGFKTVVARLLAVYDRDNQGHRPPYPFSIYKMFFLCEIIGGKAQTSKETSEVVFFEPGNLPPLSMGRTLPHQIERFFEHYRNSNMPADFD